METGRKNNYDEKVKPYLEQIKGWAENGATERQIAGSLGVSYSAFREYKKQESALATVLKKRPTLVNELRGALIKKALGYRYEETKIITTEVQWPDDLFDLLLESGLTEQQIKQSKLIKTEKNRKHMSPDVAAINLALKNYDKDNWSNDPQMLDIRKEELEIKKKIADREDW